MVLKHLNITLSVLCARLLAMMVLMFIFFQDGKASTLIFCTLMVDKRLCSQRTVFDLENDFSKIGLKILHSEFLII